MKTEREVEKINRRKDISAWHQAAVDTYKNDLILIKLYSEFGLTAAIAHIIANPRF